VAAYRNIQWRHRPTAVGRTATVESEREQFDRQRSQYDPLLPVVLQESGHSQISLNRRKLPFVRTQCYILFTIGRETYGQVLGDDLRAIFAINA
jgi:hypothetical protein